MEKENTSRGLVDEYGGNLLLRSCMSHYSRTISSEGSIRAGSVLYELDAIRDTAAGTRTMGAERPDANVVALSIPLVAACLTNGYIVGSRDEISRLEKRAAELSGRALGIARSDMFDGDESYDSDTRQGFASTSYDLDRLTSRMMSDSRDYDMLDESRFL